MFTNKGELQNCPSLLLVFKKMQLGFLSKERWCTMV